MQTDRKRHLEAGGTSGIPRRILICEVNNKVWTQGQSKAALQLSSLRRVMWSNCTASENVWIPPPPKKKKKELNHTGIQVLQGGFASLQDQHMYSG